MSNFFDQFDEANFFDQFDVAPIPAGQRFDLTREALRSPNNMGDALGRVAAAVVPDVVGTAAERAAEAAGRVYDWSLNPPQIVKDIVAAAEKSVREAPSGSLEENLAKAGLFAGAFVEPMTSPLAVATMGTGAAIRPLTQLAHLGKVAPEVVQAVQAVSGTANLALAAPAAVEAKERISEAIEDPSLKNIGSAAGYTALTALGAVASVVDFAGASRAVIPRTRLRVVSDKEWDAVKDRVKATQSADDAYWSKQAAQAEEPLALPGEESQALLVSPREPLARPPLGGRVPPALPPAPAVADFVRTVIPSGETIRIPEAPTETQLSTAREAAKTKAFNARVKRIIDTFREDGVSLSRKQAAEMARLTDPREYSLTRQTILDTYRPLEDGAVSTPPAKAKNPLKGFEELTPEMVGITPEKPVTPKKTGVIAVPPQLLEGSTATPAGLGEPSLPLSPRMIELERPMFDSGFVDAEGNTVWVDERGLTIDRRTYQDPRERVRLPDEQAIYEQQLAERVEIEKQLVAAERLDKVTQGSEVMVSLPGTPAPTKAIFAGKDPKAPSTSRIITPEGEMVVPNTAIHPVNDVTVSLTKVQPTVTSRRPRLTREAAPPTAPTAPSQPAKKSPLDSAREEMASLEFQYRSLANYLDELKSGKYGRSSKKAIQTKQQQVDETKAKWMAKQAEVDVMAENVESSAPEAVVPVVFKVKDPTVGGWDVQIGANKYRIYRDPEDRNWYLDHQFSHYSRNFLSSGTKADAIKYLQDEEPRIRKRIETEKATAKRLRDLGKKMAANAEAWADDVLKSYQGKISSNPFLDPEWVAASALKGAILMGRGATTFARWSKGMIAEMGESIKPHLKNLWKYIHNEDVPGILSGRRSVQSKPGSVKITPAELIQKAVGDVAENRRIFMAMRAGTGVAKNPEVKFTTKPDAKGISKPITVGAIQSDNGKSYEAWMEETAAWMTPEQITQARSWYRDANKAFRQIYGMDMPKELLLWLMSQQRVSPGGGIGFISHVKDMLAGIGVGKKGGLAHEKLMAVLSGEIDEDMAPGLGRKLLDFIDSGELRDTRTFHGGDPQMGYPAVADIWSARDSGHVDHQTLSRLVEMASTDNLYLNGEKVTLEITSSKTIRDKDKLQLVPNEVTYKTPSMAEPIKLEIDLTSSPGGTQYEGISKWMNEGAKRLNLATFNGASDWTPIEFQAVGWMRTLMQYGEPGQTVAEAFEVNTRHIPAEVSYSSGAVLPFEFPAWGDLSVESQRTITTNVLNKLVPDLVKVIGGSLRVLRIAEGEGRFGGDKNPMIVVSVLGSESATTILRDSLGYITDQAATMSWRTGVGGNDSRALIIRKQDKQPFSEAELHRLTEDAQLGGYSVMPSPEGGDMILITDADRNFTPKAFTAEKIEPLIKKLTAWSEDNPDLPLDIQDVPSRVTATANNWEANPDGKNYLQKIIGAGGGTRVSQLVDLRNRYAKEYLEPEFAAHSPQLLEQFRAERADAKGRWLPDAIARRDFHGAIAAATKKHPYGKAVTVKSAEEYGQKGFKLLLSPDKTAGVGVAPDGDLVSVFKAVGSKANIDALLEQAATRAIKLDAYATGDGFLINKYGKLGFRPVAVVPFNRDYAPKGWPYGRLGTPDIVYMVLDPEGLTGAPPVRNNWSKVKDRVPVMGFEDAVKKQLEVVNQLRARNSTSSRKRGSINIGMLNYMGQTTAGGIGGYVYGYNKDPDAPLDKRVLNGLMWGVMGLAAGNPSIRNAFIRGVYHAKIPVKYFGPKIKRDLGGMDNWVVFTKSALGELDDVIKSEAPLAMSLKNAAAVALDTLESMRAKASPTDWYAVGQFLSNRGNPGNILDSKLREAALVTRSTIDDFTIDLIGSGLVRPGSDLEFTMMLNHGKYLTRTYRIFTDPDFEYDPVKQQRAVAEYAAQLVLEGDTRPLSELHQEGFEQTIFQKAKARGTVMAPNAQSFALGKGIARVDGSILQPRKELSDAWRDMMGEITDPVHAASLTVDRMADILAADITQTKMADVGLQLGLFSRNATATHNIPVANTGNEIMYGSLNKLFTTREVADGLMTARAYRSHSLLIRGLALTTGSVKIGKTVLNPISYAPNFLSALIQPLVQGHWLQMVYNPRNYKGAFSIVFDTPFPSNAEQVKADIPLLIKHGLLKQNVNLNDILETVRTSGVSSMASRMVTWFPKTTKIPKTLMQGALTAYGKMEEFPRIIGFYAEVGRYAEVLFGKKLDQLSQTERAVVYERALEVSKKVYPNSQNVPDAIKKLSTTGTLEPFVAFQYEIFRTIYASAKIAVSDIKEGTQTKNGRMVSAGVVRLSSLIGALWGAYALNEAFNRRSGVSGEQDKAMRRRFPEWDRTGKLIITHFSPDEVAYANQSYIMPQSIPAAAIEAALKGVTPQEATLAFLKETVGIMVSDGGLVIKPLVQVATGRNEFGRSIYPEDGGKFFDVSSIAAKDVRDVATEGQNLLIGANYLLKSWAPGFITESTRWYKAARDEVGPDGQLYKVGDLIQRLAGVRVQRIDIPLQFNREAGELFSRINTARTEYGRARNRRDATPQSIEDAYQLSEQARKIVFRDLVNQIRDAELLNQPKQQILSNLREAGIPSDLLLGAINGFYVPGEKVKGLAARDRFEAMMNQPQAKRDATWAQIQAAEPMLAKAFRPLWKEWHQARTEEERMLLSLGDNDGTRARIIAQILLRQPSPEAKQAKYRDLYTRGLIRGQTYEQLQNDKVWSEARALLKVGQDANLFPAREPNATPPTNPGATLRRPPSTPSSISKFREGEVYRDRTTGQLRQYRGGQFVPVKPSPPTATPPPPPKRTSFNEGTLYKDPDTGVIRLYRNGQFV